MNQSTLQSITTNFTKEIKKVSDNQLSSLSYFKHPLHLLKEDNSPTNQFISIGGTNLKTNGTTTKVPPLNTANDLLNLLQPHIKPTTTHLNLSFAFPLKPLIRDGQLDGQLAKKTKEHQLDGLQDSPIGQLIQEHLATKDHQLTITCANDIAWLATYGQQHTQTNNLIALIVGTGFNLGFLKDKTVISLESGNFNQFNPQDTTKTIDRFSNRPNDQLFEKEIAGRYLYRHYNLKHSGHPNYPLTTTKTLNHKAAQGDQIAQEILFHSAQLVAAQLAGLLEYLQPKTAIPLITQGSVIHYGHQYKKTVTETLASHTNHTVELIESTELKSV